MAWLRHALCGGSPFLPEPEWYRDGVHWCCRYPYSASTTAEHITREEVMEFLLFCLRKNIVCASVKRANFRRREGGGILWVDIGCDIMPMNVDYFIDSAARLYAIAILGWADEELRRRERGPKTEDTFAAIPGFAGFYLELLTEHASRFWATAPKVSLPAPYAPASNVTLLIKACAMDAAALFEQARAIVTQLQVPRPFHERILAIDPFQGPFLRQYTSGDYALLLQEADRLREAGLIDRVLIAPDSPEAVAAINERWFGVACEKSHSCKGVPVAPQLWAFDQVTTKYVLQCDADVLIGRTDLNHDYLGEMLAAAEADGVMGVAFNIPHGPGALSRPYAAPAGEYVPEVRCGLLDLIRVRGCCPLPNMVTGGALVLSWYRSLQQHQNAHGLRTLRGGDPRTYYVHPPNEWKIDQQALARARDLIGQGRIPPTQQDQWDLLGSAADWQYERRTEDIVFLLKGRNTPIDRVQRCVASLVMQDVQEFGAVVIDDASDGELPYLLPHLLAPIAARTTLVRRDVPHGRMPNFITAISEICTNPETLIVILDIDDALLVPTVVRRLKGFYDEGADVVLGSMFRPDKPIKLYHPQFTNVRPAWGGEVWIHLRSFRKKLFDALPHSYLQIDGEWIAQCTDYATMIPMVEMCQSPRYIPEYLYFHERTTPRTAELRQIKDGIIRRILGKEPLTAVPALV